MMIFLTSICLMTLAFLAVAPGCRAESEADGKGEGWAAPIPYGTRIQLVVGGTVIPVVLNSSTASRALLERLPYTVQLQRYEHDYCGVMSSPLPFDAKDLHSGWNNGDIAFAVEGNYFAILYKDEEISGQYDGMVTLGVLDCPASVMDTLDGNISVRIERNGPQGTGSTFQHDTPKDKEKLQ